jgi:hypothetical protein
MEKEAADPNRASYLPLSPAGRVHHLDLRPWFARKQLEAESDRLTCKDHWGGQGGLADLGQLSVLLAVQFQCPRVAIDN